MSWLDWFKKKAPEKEIVRVRTPGPVSRFKISDFPRSKYSVYYEMLIDRDVNGKVQPGVGCIRFYSYKGGPKGGLITYSTVQGTPQEIVDKLDNLVEVKMKDFKV